MDQAQAHSPLVNRYPTKPLVGSLDRCFPPFLCGWKLNVQILHHHATEVLKVELHEADMGLLGSFVSILV